MYSHVHLSSVESLAKFYTQLKDGTNPDFKSKVQGYTRCISFGFAFDPYQALLQGETHIFKQVEKILEVCGDRLRGFRQLGAYLSPCYPAIWQALKKHCPAIEYLDGFSLELVAQSSDAFIQDLFSFQAIKRLTTTIVWLPPSFVPEVRRRMLLTEEEKKRSGLLGRNCRRRFAKLESLRTPLLRWDNLLVEAVIIADLPKLHTLQLGVWDSDSVTRFFQKHGSKLAHVDLLLCRWSEWPSLNSATSQASLRRLPDRFQIEHILMHCPSLRTLTLHQPESLRKLADRSGLLESASRLKTICLGSTDNSSYASMLEYQPSKDVSFVFKNLADLRVTQRKLLETPWKLLLPYLQSIEVYLPSFMLEATVPDSERARQWEETMAGKVETLDDMVPHGDVTRAISLWEEELKKQGIILLVRESLKEAL